MRPEEVLDVFDMVSLSDFCAEEIDFDFGGRNSGQFGFFGRRSDEADEWSKALDLRNGNGLPLDYFS